MSDTKAATAETGLAAAENTEDQNTKEANKEETAEATETKDEPIKENISATEQSNQGQNGDGQHPQETPNEEKTQSDWGEEKDLNEGTKTTETTTTATTGGEAGENSESTTTSSASKPISLLSPASQGGDIHEQHQDRSSRRDSKGKEELRTLYVSGLPSDVKEREMYNFFRFFEGFEDATIRVGRTTVSFVLFKSGEAATKAMEKCNGLVFDRDLGAPLRIEFARSNSKVREASKRPRPSVQERERPSPRMREEPLEKRPRREPPPRAAGGYGGGFSEADLRDVSSLVRDVLYAPDLSRDRDMSPARGAYGDALAGSSGLDYPGSLVGYGDGGYMGRGLDRGLDRELDLALDRGRGRELYDREPPIRERERRPPSMDRGGASARPGETAPCSTLFVANIPHGTIKADLVEIFSRLNGFRSISYKDGKPVCFVDFEDVTMSRQAMNTLQGFRMRPDDPNGLRVEYAKSRMNSRTRDETTGASYGASAFGSGGYGGYGY